ncbi:MAG: DUF2190 family protein [Kiritimatiellae bacterium]|nr:DUF2190 family protein [Kiritimatiellia bacterium]
MKRRILNFLARLCRPRWDFALANVAEGSHVGSLTKLADAAITTRHLLVKFGTDANHIAACGADEVPIGPCTDEPSAAEQNVNVAMLGMGDETLLVVASEEVTYGSQVYTAASGKVQDTPTAAGTYYYIGLALNTASGDGELIELQHCVPVKYIVT